MIGFSRVSFEYSASINAPSSPRNPSLLELKRSNAGDINGHRRVVQSTSVRNPCKFVIERGCEESGRLRKFKARSARGRGLGRALMRSPAFGGALGGENTSVIENFGQRGTCDPVSPSTPSAEIVVVAIEEQNAFIVICPNPNSGMIAHLCWDQNFLRHRGISLFPSTRLRIAFWKSCKS